MISNRWVALVLECYALASASSAVAQAPRPAIDGTSAVATFAEAHALCTADHAKLWGVSLCGPMMFVDPQTHQAVSNQMTVGAVRDESIYRFSVPPNAGVSNTSLLYHGTRWTMITWPLPADADARAVMLMHESYHRIQPQLGLEGSSGLGVNGHLDTEQGRVWLRGELHALRASLQATGAARTGALRGALLMRAYRRSLFNGSATTEAAVEINEGLAESTGIDAGLPPERRTDYALRDLASIESAPSYVREFPYGIGPAYAELLDAAQPAWRASLKGSSDLGSLAGEAYGVTVATPSASGATAIIARYGGAQIEAEERTRAVAAAARAARWMCEFVDGPTLSMPLQHMQITFNPTAVEQFAEYGSVYHTLHVTDDWGTLEVTGGDALIGPSFNVLSVPAPVSVSGPNVEGAGWSLQLAPGYLAAPDPQRPKSVRIVKGA